MKGEKMKTILLTGANGGLGNAIAKRLLQENHRVILIYHQNIENIQELTKEYPNHSLYTLDKFKQISLCTIYAVILWKKLRKYDIIIY